MSCRRSSSMRDRLTATTSHMSDPGSSSLTRRKSISHESPPPTVTRVGVFPGSASFWRRSPGGNDSPLDEAVASKSSPFPRSINTAASLPAICSRKGRSSSFPPTTTSTRGPICRSKRSKISVAGASSTRIRLRTERSGGISPRSAPGTRILEGSWPDVSTIPLSSRISRKLNWNIFIRRRPSTRRSGWPRKNRSSRPGSDWMYPTRSSTDRTT